MSATTTEVTTSTDLSNWDFLYIFRSVVCVLSACWVFFTRRVELLTKHRLPTMECHLPYGIKQCYLPSRHKWTHFILTQASQAGTRITYLGGIAGLSYLGDWLHTKVVYLPTDGHPSKYYLSSAWPGVEIATCWSQVQHPNHYTTKLLLYMHTRCISFFSITYHSTSLAVLYSRRAISIILTIMGCQHIGKTLLCSSK